VSSLPTYFNPDIEPLLNTPLMHEVQWAKLQRAIRFEYEKVPYDRERMDAAGVTPDGIRSLDDFSRAFPPIKQADFRAVFAEIVAKHLGGEQLDRIFPGFAGQRLDWLGVL